jgi:hypothetical protein
MKSAKNKVPKEQTKNSRIIYLMEKYEKRAGNLSKDLPIEE